MVYCDKDLPVTLTKTDLLANERSMLCQSRERKQCWGVVTSKENDL